MALSTVAMLINIETMPAVTQIVEKKLTHTRYSSTKRFSSLFEQLYCRYYESFNDFVCYREAVRKRAVIALLRFHQLSAESINLTSKLQQVLFDTDFSVIAAAITAYLHLVKVS